MNKQTILTIIVALMPSYFASLSGIGIAFGVIFISTLMGVIITIGAGAEDDKVLMDKVRLGWILHLLGVCVTFGVHSF